MAYFLRAPVRGQVVELNEDQYRAYEQAQLVLARAFAIEETYEVLVSNYLDFECYLLEQAATTIVRRDPPQDRLFQLRVGATVRVVNILTSARMYVDQTPQLVRDCCAADNQAKLVSQLFSAEYDGHPEYRFMEALRNHVQHSGLPVQSARESIGWTSHDDDRRLEVYVEVASLRSSLSQDRGFKASVLNEMEDKVDLKHYTRRYVECLSSAHVAVREMIASPARMAREQVEEAHTRVADSAAAVSLVATDSDGKENSLPLLLLWDDIRLKLIQRNQKLANLHRSHVIDKSHKSP